MVSIDEQGCRWSSGGKSINSSAIYASVLEELEKHASKNFGVVGPDRLRAQL